MSCCFIRFPFEGDKKASKSLESSKLLAGRKNDVIFHWVLLHKRNKFLEVDEIGRSPRATISVVGERPKIRGEDGSEIPGVPRWSPGSSYKWS